MVRDHQKSNRPDVAMPDSTISIKQVSVRLGPLHCVILVIQWNLDIVKEAPHLRRFVLFMVQFGSL